MRARRRTAGGAEILLVEDNPGDVFLTREAFKLGQLNTNISVADDGLLALAMLRRQGQFIDQPRPDLILLDLNLPRKSGHELLEDLKSDQQLRQIPVVVLTSSSAENDISLAYSLHANGYLVKPPDMNSFIELVGAIENFWLRAAELADVC